MSLASTAPVGATDEFRPCSKVMYGKAPLVVLLCPSRLPRKTEKLAQGQLVVMMLATSTSHDKLAGPRALKL